MASIVSLALPMLAAALVGRAETAPAPTSRAASRPATAPEPKPVKWHGDYQAAAAAAKKRAAPLLVIYFDPAAPASQTLEETVLADPATGLFLSAFAAVRLNATTGPGKKRLAQAGAAEAPLTQVLSPKGELLDSLPGCIVPPSAFRQRLDRSLAYWRAANAKPYDAAARWRAVQARLALTTRDKAAKEIDKLLELPPAKLPKGVTPARLHLAKGHALLRAAPKDAEKHLSKARELAPDDADVAGKAMLSLADLYFRTDRPKEAHELAGLYIKRFGKGADIGRACLTKALVEVLALSDPGAAAKTLEAFIKDHPDNPDVVRARRLLEHVQRAAKKKGPAK